MLGNPIIFVRHEPMSTLHTLINGCAALDDPSFQTTGCDYEVESPLSPHPHAGRLFWPEHGD